jgi:hypothetical protein
VEIANYNPDNECVFVPYQTGSMFGQLRYPNLIVLGAACAHHDGKSHRAGSRNVGRNPPFFAQRREGGFILPFSRFSSLADGISMALG